MPSPRRSARLRQSSQSSPVQGIIWSRDCSCKTAGWLGSKSAIGLRPFGGTIISFLFRSVYRPPLPAPCLPCCRHPHCCALRAAPPPWCCGLALSPLFRARSVLFLYRSPCLRGNSRRGGWFRTLEGLSLGRTFGNNAYRELVVNNRGRLSNGLYQPAQCAGALRRPRASKPKPGYRFIRSIKITRPNRVWRRKPTT
jgi:hypothetical protein